MVVSYDKLWKLMKDNKLKKKDLIAGAKLNHRYMAKLGHNEPVHMEGLIRLCQVFHCDIGDIMEVRQEGEV